jgi:ATP-dependent RNA helicase DDX55/SPB4
LLASLQPAPQKTIVYVATCAQVDYFQHLLPVALAQSDALGFTVIPLHGKHVPGVRQKNFTRFLNAVTPAILLTTDVAARGLDVPQVDLVVQFDPPVDPKVFIHRCGRAGRAGRKGLSVVFLQPEEQDYVGFMEVRKTPILPLTQPALRLDDDNDDGSSSSSNERIVAATIQAMRKVVLSDRALHDKAQRAFVSWVRAYSKHQTSSIFRVGKLDWEALGNAWALLRLPRMPELKRWTGDRSLGVEVDMDSYAYANAQREKARRSAEEEKEEQPDAAATNEKTRKRLKSAPGDGRQKATPAWSRKAEDHAERLRRREKKQRRRAAERTGKKTADELEQERQLHALLEQVKQRKIEDDTFEGFGD